MRETGHTIREWALETFGECKDHGLILNRAGEEWNELVEKLLRGASPDEIARETADIIIVLARLPAELGIDVFETIDEKMALNRRRKWRTSGDGFGQHVEEACCVISGCNRAPQFGPVCAKHRPTPCDDEEETSEG